MRRVLLRATLGVGLAGVLLALSLLYGEVRALQARIEVLAEAVSSLENERVELADLMLRMQIHADKLYFAGQEAYWELASFYLEELEEAAASIAGQDILEGEVNVSNLMQGLVPPEVDRMRSAVAAQDPQAFQDGYQQLLTACNACHRATGHPFVVIREPRRPALDNQDYEPSSVPAIRSFPEETPSAHLEVRPVVVREEGLAGAAPQDPEDRGGRPEVP